MKILTVRYESLDGRLFDKPVILNEEEADNAMDLLDKIFQVDHPIVNIKSFKVEDMEDMDDEFGEDSEDGPC